MKNAMYCFFFLIYILKYSELECCNEETKEKNK